MVQKSTFAVFTLILLAVVVTTVVYSHNMGLIDVKSLSAVVLLQPTSSQSSCDDKSSAKLIEMSKLLNQAMHRVGRLSCEISQDQVSQNGGWCSKISGRNSSQHLTDTYLAQELSTLLRGKRVVSFGDGPGVYKEMLLKMNEVKTYDAYDGAPYTSETTDNRVAFLDLSVPIYHLPKYDWVVSLEVAEHIPREFESIYMDNVVRHALEGVVLSWAHEGQGGHSHVNTRNFSYVKEQMEKRNFRHDEELSDLLKQKSAYDWFKTNINVYLRGDDDDDDV
jgi:hypothetical protein